MGSKGWSFLKSAYASAAAAVEQTAAQVCWFVCAREASSLVGPSRAGLAVAGPSAAAAVKQVSLWCRCCRSMMLRHPMGQMVGGFALLLIRWLRLASLPPTHTFHLAHPAHTPCRTGTRSTWAAARWPPRCTPPQHPVPWVPTTAAMAAVAPLATKRLVMQMRASGAAAAAAAVQAWAPAAAAAAPTSSLLRGMSGGLAGTMLLPAAAARAAVLARAAGSSRRRMRSGAAGMRGRLRPPTRCLPMARQLMPMTGASGRQCAQVPSVSATGCTARCAVGVQSRLAVAQAAPRLQAGGAPAPLPAPATQI